MFVTVNSYSNAFLLPLPIAVTVTVLPPTVTVGAVRVVASVFLCIVIVTLSPLFAALEFVLFDDRVIAVVSGDEVVDITPYLLLLPAASFAITIYGEFVFVPVTSAV